MKKLWCFLVGHNIATSYRLDPDPDFCWRCGMEYPQDDRKTLPIYLQRAYSWLVERDWPWFERLDAWIIETLGRRLPHWWAY